MSILTGKAKSDFEKWLLTDGYEVIENGTIEYDLYYMCKYMIPQNMVYAKIIEWLDSVGIYVEVGYLHAYKEWYRDVSTETGSCYIRGWETRQEATKAAIEKANELYNKRK